MRQKVNTLPPLNKEIRLLAKSTQLRITSPCRREFDRTTYRPGVISISRLIWGTLGGGMLLGLIAILSQLTGISVLFPPLAATCFIVTTCPYLRVARPKPVIVGHFIASLCGLAGVWAGENLIAHSDYVTAAKLGFSVLLATAFMQLFDTDHPPAAATSAIPAILPLPMAEYLLPFYMAWGATIAVMFSFAWNRIWFEFPAQDDDYQNKHWGLYMEKPQIIGTVFCITGFALMSLQTVSQTTFSIGLASILIGVIVLGAHHFLELKQDVSDQA